MLINKNEELFYERYRPQRIEDLILPENIKQKLQRSLNNQNIPNLGLFSDNPGTGKTSTAKAIISEIHDIMGADAMFINASLENGIDTLRGKIQAFASKASFDCKIKIVVLDEADKFSKDGQAAFRGFIEEFSANTRFIFTGNYKENMIKPLLDRLEVYDFNDFPRQEMIKPIYQRLEFILNIENIRFDQNTVVSIINTFYPSIRSMVKTLQQYSSSGALAVPDSVLDKLGSFNTVLQTIKDKNYKQMIEEVNKINSPSGFYKVMYSKIEEIGTSPKYVVILAKYQHMDSSVRDKNLNLAACCAELMQQ